MQAPDITLRDIQVAPARERGLKFEGQLFSKGYKVAPARERGLKCVCADRSKKLRQVAPARERGLKSKVEVKIYNVE